VDESAYGDFRARREATVWQRLNRVLRILLCLAVWLVIISLFLPPYNKFKQSRAEIEKLQLAVVDQKLILARQTREVNLLKTDPTYLETIARDRLDLMKEGETIFRFDQQRGSKDKPAPPAKR
jgi:cell division protein FtsB